MRALPSILLALALALVLGPLVAVIAGAAPEAAALGGGAWTNPVTKAFEERAALLTTLEVGGVAALVALGLGGAFALGVVGSDVPGRRGLAGLAALVLVLPPYLTAASWIDLFGPVGRVARPLEAAFGKRALFVAERVYTPGAAGLVLGACLFPLVALAVASADRRLDRRILEAARLARGRRGELRVALAALASPALGAALAVFAFVLTEFAVPQVLRARTLGEAIYDRIQENDRAGAAALGLPLVLLVAVAGGLGVWLLGRRRVAAGAGLEGDAPRFEPRRRGLAGKVAGLAIGVLAITPGLVCPLVSFTTLASTGPLVGPRAAPPGTSPGATHGPRVGPGRDAYEDASGLAGPADAALAERRGFGAALARAWAVAGDDARRTVVLGVLAATLAAIVAGVLGRALARRRGLATLGLGALAAGLAVPAPLVGLGLVVLWSRPLAVGSLDLAAAVYDTSAVVVLAWLARFLPLAVILARAGFARVPHELEEAAALLGKRPLERLRRVVLPLAAPGVVAAWLATYVLATTEFEASAIVVPPGRPLLSVTVVNLVHYGRDAEIAACALLLVGAIALPLIPGVLGLAWVMRKRGAGPT